MATFSDNAINQIVFNKVTQEQYEQMVEDGTINDNEFYITESNSQFDDSNLVHKTGDETITGMKTIGENSAVIFSTGSVLALADGEISSEDTNIASMRLQAAGPGTTDAFRITYNDTQLQLRSGNILTTTPMKITTSLSNIAGSNPTSTTVDTGSIIMSNGTSGDMSSKSNVTMDLTGLSFRLPMTESEQKVMQFGDWGNFSFYNSFQKGATTTYKIGNINSESGDDIELKLISNKVSDDSTESWLELGTTTDATILSNTKSTSSKTDMTIPTMGWVNNPSLSKGVVHTTGNETIDGYKIFNEEVFIKNDLKIHWEGGISSSNFGLINIYTHTDSSTGEQLGYNIEASDDDGFRIRPYRKESNRIYASTIFQHNRETNQVTTLSPAIGSKDKQIATTEWVLNSIYPVGSIYTSVNNTNPSSLFGGTWSSNGQTTPTNGSTEYHWKRTA